MNSKVLVIDMQGWGGIAHYTFNLMQALAKDKRFDCVLITDREYELSKFSPGFEVVKQNFKNTPYAQAILSLIKTIILTKPKILHVQTMMTVRRDWIWFIIARLFGYRIVLTAHNILPHELDEQKAFFMRTAFGIIYKCSSAIIVHSRYSKNRLIQLFKVDPAKVSVMPHGNYIFLRTQEISKQQAQKQLRIPMGRKVILHFGALRQYKGVDIVLEAFRKVRDAHDDVLLLLVGKAMQLPQDYFKELIGKLGLDDSVVLKADYVPLEQIQVYFYASDLVVFAYREIDTSGALQLAYAFSKPVIATSTGSMPEVLEENKNGLLVPGEDPLALSEAIKKLLFDPVLLQQMGDRSFALAKEKFGWDDIAYKTIELYTKLR